MLLTHRKVWNLALLATLILLSLLSIPAPRSVHAQSERCFPQTNHCISGRFREFWEQNGGLAVFGYPVSAPRDERNRDTGKIHLTQWFERNRFELHPENDRTYDVLLGRLGDDTLFKMGRDWRAEHRAGQPGTDCETMVAGGKDFLLCGAFRSYYKTHGLEFDGRPGVAPAESLALFGLPLTQAVMETNASGDTVLTQWFERTRMEWHPNNPEPYKVLLGLLGNELRQEAPAPAPAGAPPVTFVDQSGAVHEQQPNGQARRIGTLPSMGRVLDAVRSGDRVVVLREQGLQSLDAAGRATTIATFTRGNAVVGTLLAPAGSSKIIYTYGRRSDTPMGFTGIVGVIENGTARKVHEAPNQMSVLGLTRDERDMYLINWGGDPAIGEIQVRSIENGAFEARIPFQDAYGAAALSPDRNMIATVSLATTYPDTLLFYDLNNRTAPLRRLDLPRRTWGILQLVWSASPSRVVYALAYPAAEEGLGKLYRIDPAQGKAELVAGNIAMSTRLHTISADGRWLLTEMQQRAVVIDLTNGQMQSLALPQEAVVAHWR